MGELKVNKIFFDIKCLALYNKDMDYTNYIRRVKNFRMKKSLGQNFLINYKTIETILSCVNENDDVLEIGAGVGFVTEELVKKAKSVTAIEIDKEAIKILEKNCDIALKTSGSNCDFKIIEQSILETNLHELANGRKFKIVANIPYCITSPILVHLLGEIDDIAYKNRNVIDEIILMVQLEVAKRLVANEKSTSVKDYGLLSILAQFWADVEIIEHVSKKSFYPSPKVDSALLRLKINDRPRVEINPLLRRVIKASFATRRKNIKNCLQNAGFLNIEQALEKVSITPNLRGEKLSLDEFRKLAELYENNQNQSTGKN